ncbi:MAG TPA: right-handed parallel beta-helix repeat-containing protein [Stenomitos sp.]
MKQQLSSLFTATLAHLIVATSLLPHPSVASDFGKLQPKATGKIYYVSGLGNDSNSGLSVSQAFRTLQRAADLTAPGDTVLVMNGIYTSADNTNILMVNNSGLPGNWIRYRAYPGHKPKLQLNYNWSGISINGASYILVEGFTVQGNAKTITLAEARREQNNLNNLRTVANCISVASRYDLPSQRPHHIIIRKNTAVDCPGGGIYSNHSDYLRIEDNTAARNSFYSPFGNSGISIYQSCDIDTATNTKIFIRRNITYKNENKIPFYFSDSDPSKRTISDGNGIIVDDNRNSQSFIDKVCSRPYGGQVLVENNLSYDNGGRGIHIYSSDNVLVRYNTVYQNARTKGFCCDLRAITASHVSFYSNIVFSRPDRPSTEASYQTSNIRFANNLYFGGTGNPNQTESDIVADPEFINATTTPSTANFRLQPSSPAINKGTTVSPKVDLLKNPRPRGSAADLGAYEIQ